MIREFKPEDIDKVMRIWMETSITSHGFIDQNYWMGNFKEVKKMMHDADTFVSEEKGVIQGFIGLIDDYIGGLFVLKDFQSQGVGKKLADHAKSLHPALSLHVYKKNVRATAFYRREGFAITHQQKDEKTGEVEYRMNWKTQA